MDKINYKKKATERECRIKQQILKTNNSTSSLNENDNATLNENDNVTLNENDNVTLNPSLLFIPNNKIKRIEKRYNYLKEKSEGKKYPPLTKLQILVVLLSILYTFSIIAFAGNLLAYHIYYETECPSFVHGVVVEGQTQYSNIPEPRPISDFIPHTTIFFILSLTLLIAVPITTTILFKRSNKKFISNKNNIYSHIYFLTRNQKLFVLLSPVMLIVFLQLFSIITSMKDFSELFKMLIKSFYASGSIPALFDNISQAFNDFSNNFIGETFISSKYSLKYAFKTFLKSFSTLAALIYPFATSFFLFNNNSKIKYGRDNKNRSFVTETISHAISSSFFVYITIALTIFLINDIQGAIEPPLPLYYAPSIPDYPLIYLFKLYFKI